MTAKTFVFNQVVLITLLYYTQYSLPIKVNFYTKYDSGTTVALFYKCTLCIFSMPDYYLITTATLRAGTHLINLTLIFRAYYFSINNKLRTFFYLRTEDFDCISVFLNPNVYTNFKDFHTSYVNK